MSNPNNDPKTEIVRALTELAQAVELSVPAIDHAAMGPFGLTKALLKGLPRARLVTLNGFAGTWLDMLVRETQEIMVDGVAIVPGLLPPASMLRLVNGSEEEQAILAAGATVSVRPPKNELLLLSPARADAAVYVIEEGGLRKIADGVAALVADEVRTILAAR